MIIGVTGNTGSGKSIVARELARCGWELIDADLIGREVVENDPEVLGSLARSFGSDILDDSGSLQRHLLAQKAFDSPENTRTLNAIVHPALIDRLSARIAESRKRTGHTVVDCALILEWNIKHLFDVLVCVWADEELRKKRIMVRDGRTEAEVMGMFAAQLPEIEKMRLADIVLANNGSAVAIRALGTMLSELPRLYGVQ